MADVRNQTPFAVEVLPLIDAEGYNVAVAIAKGSYELVRGELIPAAEQPGIVYADEFDGDPAEAPVAIPSDVVFGKAATDVVVLPPEGFHARRHWRIRRIGVRAGGVRRRVWIRRRWKLGPERRDARRRRKLAGTFDDAWRANRMPLLPEDFDIRHNQIAPKGLIARGFFRGDERVRLRNLWRRGRVAFDLPGRTVVFAVNVMQSYFLRVGQLDTVLIDAVRPRITLVWRCTVRCPTKFEEVRSVSSYLVRLRTVSELFEGA